MATDQAPDQTPTDPGARATIAAAVRFEESKADLIARAVELGEHTKGAHPADTQFLQRYYRYVVPEDIVGRDAMDVYGAALSNRELAQQRPQGTATVRVFTPTVEEHGWSCGHTVIEVVTDDMPFLVDSVTGCLGQLGRGIHLVIHPLLAVQRDIVGTLQAVLDEDPEVARSQGAPVESWMHVEIDRESDEAALRAIADALRRVLRDVREAVEDWPKIRRAALAIADELATSPPPLSEGEVSEAWELLRWLADDHFTFLGYREYDLATGPEGDLLVARAGTGLGILRSDQTVSTSFATMTAEIRAKAREKKLLILTKANSRSTVHRPAYLDYIGVKTFDADGEVTGERRFLGLFTS
nr:NAD-glutamate dehydrogenase [Acidimicrobiales bacterium]